MFGGQDFFLSEKCYVHNIFPTISQYIIGDKLLLMDKKNMSIVDLI